MLLHSFIPSFLHSFIPSFLHSFISLIPSFPHLLYFLINPRAASNNPFPSAPFALASLTQPSVTCCTSGFQLSISLLEMLLMLLAGRRARTSVSASAKMRPIWPESAMPLFAHRSPCVRDLHGAVLG